VRVDESCVVGVVHRFDEGSVAGEELGLVGVGEWSGVRVEHVEGVKKCDGDVACDALNCVDLFAGVGEVPVAESGVLVS